MSITELKKKATASELALIDVVLSQTSAEVYEEVLSSFKKNFSDELGKLNFPATSMSAIREASKRAIAIVKQDLELT